MSRGPSGAINVAWCKHACELRLIPFAAVAGAVAEQGSSVTSRLAQPPAAGRPVWLPTLAEQSEA